MWFIQEIAGLLVAATFPENWVEEGDVSIDDAVSAASDTFGSFQPMVGAIFPVAWDTIPNGFLLCDGAGYLRVDYPALYANLPAAFIVDADNFVVPDLMGRSIVGAGSGSGLTSRTPGDTGGEETHALTSGEGPSHSHGYSGPGVPIITAPGAVPADGSPSVPGSTTSSGSGDGHNTMHPFTVLTYVIVAF